MARLFAKAHEGRLVELVIENQSTLTNADRHSDGNKKRLECWELKASMLKAKNPGYEFSAKECKKVAKSQIRCSLKMLN